MTTIPLFNRYSDTQLVDVMPRLVGNECSSTAILVAGLVEFDARRLYLPLGYSSLFRYCVEFLKLTEDATLNRIDAARAARRFPIILELLQKGDLSLTAVRLLSPHLTESNYADVLREARHRTRRQIDVMVAKLNPQPPVPSVVRKLPEPKPAVASAPTPGDEPPVSLADLVAPAVAAAPPPSRRPIVAPLSESHYKLQVTIGTAARERLRAIQDLMRHRLPSGDPAAIVEHALEVLHRDLLKKKAAEVQKPRLGNDAREAKGRYIPASVKRAVFRRDRGACAFVSEDETRCGSTSGVEFHHVQPYAVGGEASVDNIEMRCRAHNGFEWQRHLDAETLALAGR